MLRGNRLLFVALGLVSLVTVGIGWWTYPSLPTTQHFRYDNPRNEEYRPGGTKCEPSALASVADAKVRLGQTEDCQKQAEEYRQSSDDLIQQTRAANAAQAQADIASQQLWTTWLQTLGGFLTLAAAIGAAIYARDAAIHTRDGNDLARDAQRAWIALNMVPKLVRRRNLPDKGSIYFRIDFIAENMGDTLASNFELATALLFKGQAETGAQINDRMLATLAKWREEYDTDETAVLLPGDRNVGSIWDERQGPELKSWHVIGIESCQPICLCAVFYRTQNRPNTVQFSWRSWYLHQIDDNGNVVTFIELRGPELGQSALCAEPFRQNLVHEEYPANDDSRH